MSWYAVLAGAALIAFVVVRCLRTPREQRAFRIRVGVPALLFGAAFIAAGLGNGIGFYLVLCAFVVACANALSADRRRRRARSN